MWLMRDVMITFYARDLPLLFLFHLNYSNIFLWIMISIQVYVSYGSIVGLICLVSWFLAMVIMLKLIYIKKNKIIERNIWPNLLVCVAICLVHAHSCLCYILVTRFAGNNATSWPFFLIEKRMCTCFLY